ncbi:MAG: ABC transporter substrate-binding protein [Desulfovibrio sp.]
MRIFSGILALLLALAAGYGLLSPAGTHQHFVIGVLQYTNSNLNTLEGFRDGMADLGYREGENLKILFSGPAQSKQELALKLRDLLARNPDLLFVSPTPAAQIAMEMTHGSSLPVVFAPVNDPVSAGVVRNIRSPEANITGVRLAPSEGRRLQLLLEVAPGVRRVFVPVNPSDASARTTMAQLQRVAPALGVTLLTEPFTRSTDIFAADFAPERIDAIFLPREGLALSRIKDFVSLCSRRKLPLSTPRYDQVEQGALMGLGFIGYEVGRQAARLAHLLLSGTPVANLPVETADDYFFINSATAAQIGIQVPEAALRRADRIIRLPEALATP